MSSTQVFNAAVEWLEAREALYRSAVLAGQEGELHASRQVEWFAGLVAQFRDLELLWLEAGLDDKAVRYLCTAFHQSCRPPTRSSEESLEVRTRRRECYFLRQALRASGLRPNGKLLETQELCLQLAGVAERFAARAGGARQNQRAEELSQLADHFRREAREVYELAIMRGLLSKAA